MPISLADIEHWDASAIREVSKALAKRGASADEVRGGLSKLPLIANWQGSGGDAAKASLDKLSAYLAAHGEEMARVSAGTGNAADEIERVRATLQRIYSDARQEGFHVDPATGEVTPLDKAKVGDPIYALQQADLEIRVKELLAAANKADADFAQAIASAGNDASAAGHPETRPDVLEALSKPLPDDPKQFHDLWEKLTPEEKDGLYQRDHSIGNHNGMPTVDRDYYNRLALGDELNQAQAAQGRADALKNQHPDWAQGHNIPPPNKPGAIFDDRLKYEAWQRQYNDALNGAKYLPDLQAVDKAVNDNPNRKLMLLDTHSGSQARAAIAIGDPDTAQHVSVTTPGLNTTVHGSIGSMTEEATNLRQESLRQLQNTPGHSLDSVSTVAWIGYDAPQIPGWDDAKGSFEGAWGVSHDDLAKAGAHNLAGFYDGIQASHQGVPPELTAIGHSYGSLTTGLALQEPGNHGVTNAIFYGSPGIEATSPEQLHLQPGHVFTMETPDDPIQMVYDGPPLTHVGAAALPPPFNVLAESALGALDATGAGQFGPNPATNPNFTHLETGTAVVPDGLGGTLSLEGAHGHSDYPRFSSDGLPRTTNYNIAAVIAGLSDDAVQQK
jgi:hypothetical protein